VCTGLGKETSLIRPSEMAAQQAQVMHACEMLGDIANMVAKAEQGRSTRVVGDSLKESVVAQKRIVSTLKEQLVAHQSYSHKTAARNKELETALDTAVRRLKNEQTKSRDLEVENKALRIKTLDTDLRASQSKRGCGRGKEGTAYVADEASLASGWDGGDGVSENGIGDVLSTATKSPAVSRMASPRGSSAAQSPLRHVCVFV